MAFKNLLAFITSKLNSSGPPEREVQVLMTHAEERRFKLEGLRVVIGGALIHFVLGCFYLWGGISLYVASYLRASDPDIDIDLVKMVFPFMNLTLCLGMPFGVKIADKIGARLLSFIGICFIALLTFITSFINSFYAYLALYGLGVGLVSGLIYVLAYSFGWKYFPEHKGTVSGAVLAGYGFGSLTFNFIALSCVNPNNLKATIVYDNHSYFDEEVYQNVPYMMRILSLCYLLIGTLGVILVKIPKKTPLPHHSIEEHHPLKPTVGANKQTKGPQSPVSTQTPSLAAGKTNTDHSVEHEHDHDHDHDHEHDHHENVIPPSECSSLKQGFKSLPFWLLLAMAFFGIFFGYLMANNYKVYGLLKLGDDSFVTTVGSIGSAANGCSRIFWATLMDKFGFRKVFFVLMCIQLALCGTLDLVASGKILFLVWYALIMFCEGGIVAMEPAAAGKVFGAKYGKLIYGFIFFGMAMANLCAFFLTKFAAKALDWSQIFWICFAFSGVALFVNFGFNQNYRFDHAKTDNNSKKIELSGVRNKV